MDYGIEFFTATCLSWQPLLAHDKRKDIVRRAVVVGDNIDQGQNQLFVIRFKKAISKKKIVKQAGQNQTE